ncbi:hypothetical protein ACFVAF_25290 [Streptomyces sp. NPDC057596]
MTAPPPPTPVLPLPGWEETAAEAAAWDDRYWQDRYDHRDEE